MRLRAQTVHGRDRLWRTISILMVGVGLAVLVGANAHLVYVAVTSQPDCVPHTRPAGEAQPYAAAGSAC